MKAGSRRHSPSSVEHLSGTVTGDPEIRGSPGARPYGWSAPSRSVPAVHSGFSAALPPRARVEETSQHGTTAPPNASPNQHPGIRATGVTEAAALK